MLKPLVVVTLGILSSLAPAEEGAAPVDAPPVEDLGGGRFKVGLVEFKQEGREIVFPAEVNMKEGALEYAIVHQNGKIHEAVLITKARPFHVNIALKILGYEESKELFPILGEDFRPTGKFPDVPAKTRNAARAALHLRWKGKTGSPEEATLNDWITNTVTRKPLAPKPWVYGGSYFHEQSFQAEASGDIVALFTNNASLFNWPGRDAALDDVWVPTTARIPDVGTPVTVTIRPFIKNKKPDGQGS